MSEQEKLIASLNALEGDIGRYQVGSGAIIHPDSETRSDDVLALYSVVDDIGRKLKCRVNEFDQYKLDGSDYRLEFNKLTQDVRIVTMVGKFVMPAGTKVSVVGRY